MSAPELPLVSIVVPVLDGERYLRESLDSIVAQSYPNIELILMDDGSTDATPEIAASYGDRVAYHLQPQRRGIYANSNDGIAIARGELIAVYHADDVYHRDIVAHEARYLIENPAVGAVFTKAFYIDGDGQPYGNLELPPEIRTGRPLDRATIVNALLTYKCRFLPTPTSMIRADVYRELGGYDQDQFKNTSDLEMWLRIARHHDIGVLDEALFGYRRGHGSSSERYHKLRLDPERFFVIMDRELGAGGRGIARSDALATYEAHRAEDDLKRAASLYIVGRRDQSRALLGAISARNLLRGGRLAQLRLVILLAIMTLLVRIPRLPVAASLLRRRLYERPLKRGFPRLGALRP